MILEAIGTSHSKTLGGGQGFGLVKCSRSMPKALQDLARGWDYPQGNDKEPIFTLRDIDDGGTRWAILNRTIPDTDFTGRTGSHVSHTLAIRHDDVFEYFRSYPGKGITPFELMLSYPWEEKWTGEPAYIEDDDNPRLADVIAKTRQVPPASGPLPPGEVTARAFDGETLEQKKTSWETGPFTSRELLDIFHQAWMAIDPWRAANLYPDIPGGDNPGTNRLHLSWACTFTTRPRNDKPDWYYWFTGPTPKRPVINLAALRSPSGAAALLSELGGPHAGAIIARAANPTEWAEEKTRDIKRDNEAKDRQEKRQRQQRIAEQVEAEKASRIKQAAEEEKARKKAQAPLITDAADKEIKVQTADAFLANANADSLSLSPEKSVQELHKTNASRDAAKEPFQAKLAMTDAEKSSEKERSSKHKKGKKKSKGRLVKAGFVTAVILMSIAGGVQIQKVLMPKFGNSQNAEALSKNLAANQEKINQLKKQLENQKSENRNNLKLWETEKDVVQVLRAKIAKLEKGNSKPQPVNKQGNLSKEHTEAIAKLQKEKENLKGEIIKLKQELEKASKGESQNVQVDVAQIRKKIEIVNNLINKFPELIKEEFDKKEKDIKDGREMRNPFKKKERPHQYELYEKMEGTIRLDAKKITNEMRNKMKRITESPVLKSAITNALDILPKTPPPPKKEK